MIEEKRIPEIRFKGFDEAWEQRKWIDTVDISTNMVDPRKSIYDNLPHIGPGNIESFTGRLLNNVNTVKEDNLISGKFHFNKGDVIYGKINPHLGKYVYAQYEGLASADAYVLNSKKGLHQTFLFAVLQTQHFYKYSVSVSMRSGMPKINRNELNEYSFMAPSEEEQEQIGKLFLNLDNLITLHQRKLENSENFKKAMLQKMFPKEGEKYPRLRFAGFTDAWEQRKLGEVVDIRSGRDYKHLSEGDIPVYGTGGYMLSVNEALSYKEDAIGIGRKGTIDKPYILRAPFWTVDTLFYAVPETNNDLDFIFNIFQNINWKQKDESTGVPSLSKTAINDIDVLVPDYKEQKTIGNFFSNLDNLITLHQRKLDNLENLKKALLQRMFI